MYNYFINYHLIKSKSILCDSKAIELNLECIKSLIDVNNEHILSICDNNKPIYYHSFWDLDSKYQDYQLRVLKLNMISYLATQNLKCTKLIIWKLNRFSKKIQADLSNIFSAYLNNIQFKTFDLHLLCNTSVSFKKHQICNLNYPLNLESIENLVDISDLVRFFVLDQYGGIYVDGDVLYLRNMQTLFKYNFVYRWSFLLDKINTAVIGIGNKNSSLNNLYDLIIQRSYNAQQLVRNFHAHIVSMYICELNDNSIYDWNSLITFHSYLFDPAWLCNDEKVARFNSKSVCYFNEFTRQVFMNESEFKLENFFPGAFTYHIHMRASGDYILNMTYFIYFENYFKSILNIKY